MADGFPIARTTLRARYVRVLIRCKACQRTTLEIASQIATKIAKVSSITPCRTTMSREGSPGAVIIAAAAQNRQEPPTPIVIHLIHAGA